MIGQNSGVKKVLTRIPKNSVGVEIGVWQGDSSELFLRHARYMHLVDAWSIEVFRQSDEFGGFQKYLDRYSEIVGGSHESDFELYYESLYQSVRKRFADRPVTIHRCASEQFFNSFNSTVDWVYIDGSHSFDGCLVDLFGAKKIATYAIFGDDYGGKCDVTNAVREFVKRTKLVLLDLGDHQYEIRL